MAINSATVSRRDVLRATAAVGAAGALGAMGTSTVLAQNSFPSTNELNKNQQVPGREGQDAPHVIVNDTGPGTVTLDFINEAPGVAFFEYRPDGQVLDEGSPHQVVNADGEHDLISQEDWDAEAFDPEDRDVVYPGILVHSGQTEMETFEAQSYVEVRLALGAERDWDFDWTQFEVGALADPETRADCMDGGYADFGFRNQGQCIRFVNTGQDSR